MLRLKDKYKKEAVSAMKKKFGYRNIMAVPKIEKVVINTGLGKLSSGKTAEEQKKLFNYVIDNLSQISGQRVILTKAKNSLIPKRDHLLKQLVRIGLKAKQLTTPELIKLFYNYYNPDSGAIEFDAAAEYEAPIVEAAVSQEQTNEV